MVLDQACLLNNSDLFLSHFDHVHAIVDTYIYIRRVYIILYVSRFYLQYFLFVSNIIIVFSQIYYIEQKNETIKFAVKLVVSYFASMYGVFWLSTYNILGVTYRSIN